ncbi:MAG: PDZ domain-containing protein [Bdellovibrionales bacterium]|nr:PDZ domain-containing protein [Bdellovibrionales bacterium]
MKKKGLLYLSIIIVSFSAFAMNFYFVQTRSYKDAFLFVCHLVDERFYDQSLELQRWAERCIQQAQKPITDKVQLLRRISDSLSELNVSHLAIYTPQEDKQIWQGIAKNTGMQARGIDGHFIVYKIDPESPAKKAGVEKGDEVVAINGKGLFSAHEVEVSSGLYSILRRQKNLEIHIEPAEIKIDEAPKLIPLSSKMAVLEISSFRIEYFDKDLWRDLSQEFSKYQYLIIDLRQNLGGSFVAMLRALSSFICTPTHTGSLLREGYKEGSHEILQDNATTAYQLETVYKARKIDLNTFSDYPCYSKKLALLIDFNTASVSEIFAQAVKESDRALVLGAASSGQMVMGIWYEMPMLGPGYSLSIPEANFISKANYNIEQRGVWPIEILYYDLELERSGKDTWLEALNKKAGTTRLF